MAYRYKTIISYWCIQTDIAFIVKIHNKLPQSSLQYRLPSIKQKFYMDMLKLNPMALILKLSFIIIDWEHLCQKTIQIAVRSKHLKY